MKIPVNPDRVQMRGIAQAPTRGHSVEAFGNYSGLDNFGKSLTGLGAAITKKSLEDDRTRALEAENKYIAGLKELDNKIRTEKQLENAADADTYYKAESQKLKEEVFKNAGIKYRQTSDDFNLTTERMTINGYDQIRDYQRGEDEKWKDTSINNRMNVLIDGVNSTQAFKAGLDDITGNVAKVYSVSGSDELVLAKSRQFATVYTAQYALGQLYKGNVAGAKEAVAAAEGLINKGQLAQINKAIHEYEQANNTVLRNQDLYKKYKGDLPGALSELDNGARFGGLSSKYEGSAGSISSGQGDSGGVSYGKYQFNSKDKVVNAFVDWLKGDPSGKKYADFLGSDVGSQEFNEKWKQLAKDDPEGFERMQDAYAKPIYYDGAAQNLKDKYGFDISGRSKALKEVLFSNSIQHGQTYGAQVFQEAAALADKPLSEMTDEELIQNIYEVKLTDMSWSSGAPDQRPGLFNRWKNERQDALSLLSTENMSPSQKEDRKKSYIAFVAQEEKITNHNMARIQDLYLNDVFTLQQSGTLNDTNMWTAKNKALANSGFTPGSDEYVELDRKLTTLYQNAAAAPEQSDTVTYNTLMDKHMKGTLQVTDIENAVNNKRLSKADIKQLYGQLRQEQQDQKKEVDKNAYNAWNEELDNQFKTSQLKMKKDRVKAVINQEIYNRGLTGDYNAIVNTAREIMKSELDSAGSVVNYYENASKEYAAASAAFGAEADRTMQLIFAGQMASNPARRVADTKEAALVANYIANKMIESKTPGSPIYGDPSYEEAWSYMLNATSKDGKSKGIPITIESYNEYQRRAHDTWRRGD